MVPVKRVPDQNKTAEGVHLMMVSSMRKALIGLAAIAGVAGNAHAFDVDPGDYTALPAGTTLYVNYSFFTTRDGLSASVPGLSSSNASLDSYIGVARFVHYMNIGGMIVDPQVILPYGWLYNGNLGSGFGNTSLDNASGFADPMVAATFWLVNKPDKDYSTYVGVTPFLSIPVGQYDENQLLNLGENRWKGILQVGLNQGLGHGFLIDLYADATFYGDNDKIRTELNLPAGTKLTQDNSYEVQAWLRYNVNKTTSLNLGYAKYWGGDQFLSGLGPNGFGTDSQEVRFAVQKFVDPTWQLQAEVFKEVDQEAGFDEDVQVNFRVLKIFAAQ
jgi:hypothetical protein